MPFVCNCHICMVSCMFPNACRCVAKCCAYLEAWVLQTACLISTQIPKAIFRDHPQRFSGGKPMHPSPTRPIPASVTLSSRTKTHHSFQAHSILSATVGGALCGIHNTSYGNTSHSEVSTVDNHASRYWKGHSRCQQSVHNTCLPKHVSITHTYRHFSYTVIPKGGKDPEQTPPKLDVRK